jgi:hypothetical protein
MCHPFRTYTFYIYYTCEVCSFRIIPFLDSIGVPEIVVGIRGKNYTDEWMDKATYFLDCVFSRTQIVRCPCSRCQNSRCLEDKRTIVIELCKNGFVLGYEEWTFHGESGARVVAEDEHNCNVGALIGWMRCLKLYK